MDEPLHPDVAELGFLIGTWRGRGTGVYPTIEPFTYEEEITIRPASGKPFLVYEQRTRRPATGEPLHAEVGYFRAVGGPTVELVVAQPTGIAEVHTGTLRDATVHLRSVEVARTPTAKEVTSVERTLVVEDATLRYELHMGAVGQPHQLHLKAVLHRA